MISEKDVETYRRDGVIVVPEVLDGATLGAGAAGHRRTGRGRGQRHPNIPISTISNRAIRLKIRGCDGSRRRTRCIRSSTRSFAAPAVIDILTRLLGPGLRLHGSKLNMKSAQYGSPVEWHQDWAFYPHTNDDVLAIGVLLDDCDLSNGPMLVTPGTHTGEVWNHHGEDGCFAGLIDPGSGSRRDRPRGALHGQGRQHVVPPCPRAARIGA